jgi:hypothetical protein
MPSLYPRDGIIVTTLARSAERVVGFHNQRSTAERCIKKSKGAIKRTRLSCRTFAANAVRPPDVCIGLQPRQFRANARDAEGGGGTVADQLAREADQDRREVMGR